MKQKFILRGLALGMTIAATALLSACSHDRPKPANGATTEPQTLTAANPETTFTVTRVTNGTLDFQWRANTNAPPATNR